MSDRPGKGGDRRRLRLRRRRAPALCAPATPTSRWPWPRPGPVPASAVAAHTPSLAAAYPDARLRRARTSRPSTGSTSCSWRCRTVSPRTSCPTWSTGWAWSSTWPPTSVCPTRPCTRPGTARSTGPPDCSPVSSTGFPSSTGTSCGGPPRIAAAGLLPHRRPPRPRAARRGRCPGAPGRRGPAAGGRRGQRHVGGGTGTEGEPPLRHRRRGLRGLRAARPPPHRRDGAGAGHHGAVHPPPRPHGPGHPGHLLRPTRRPRQADHGGRHAAPARPLRRRALRGGRSPRRRRPRRPAARTRPT